jgi:hypothetical protein
VAFLEHWGLMGTPYLMGGISVKQLQLMGMNIDYLTIAWFSIIENTA